MAAIIGAGWWVVGGSHLTPSGKKSTPAILLNIIELASIPQVTVCRLDLMDYFSIIRQLCSVSV